MIDPTDDRPARHLTPDEIAILLEPGGAGALTEEMETHRNECEECRRTMAMHEQEDRRIRLLAGQPREEREASCPEPGEYATLAANLAPPVRREALLDHAAGCDACGELLRGLAADFSAETSAEERRELEALPTATLGGQRELALRMAKASRRPRIEWMWVGKAAAVVIAVGAGWFGYNTWLAGPSPERLMAAAYTERRPFEYRIPEAAHAEVRAARGPGSSFERPAALIEAEAKIAGELRRNPDSAEWLRLRARAEMLGWNADEAIATLTRALDRTEGEPRLMAELGMAYALRAENAKRPLDYGQAIEYLGRALKANPDDPEATFNRAIVYERMLAYDQAAGEWRRYLALDPTGGWAEEARRRLRDIDEKKKQGTQP